MPSCDLQVTGLEIEYDENPGNGVNPSECFLNIVNS